MADSIVLINPATGHKYQRIDQYLSWAAARDYCKNTIIPTGGYLVTITTKEENDFILGNLIPAQLGSYTVWLGGGDTQTQGVWKWLTTTEKFSYSYWGAGEPKIANGQYIEIGTKDYFLNPPRWYVGNDTETNYFICEWGGAAYKDYVSSASLSDMNANNFPEIATLYIADATGKITVQVKDASTKAIISTVVFGKPNTSFPMSVAVLPDMNANGFQEIAVLLIDNITLKATQEIRDASTGVLISSVPF
jgi:hypothetical protein